MVHTYNTGSTIENTLALMVKAGQKKVPTLYINLGAEVVHVCSTKRAVMFYAMSLMHYVYLYKSFGERDNQIEI